MRRNVAPPAENVHSFPKSNSYFVTLDTTVGNKLNLKIIQ